MMRSAKLTFVGFGVAAVLMLSNIFMLRYVTDAVRTSFSRPSKVRLLSRYTLQPYADVHITENVEESAKPIVSQSLRNDLQLDSSSETKSLSKNESKTADYDPPLHLPRPKLQSQNLNNSLFQSSTAKIHPDFQNLLNDINVANNFSCHLKVKFGRDEDKIYGHETWRLCFDDPFKLKNPCIVYSFGIAYDFSFDDDTARFGCQVYSFDPSMEAADHQRESGVMFFNIGIAELDSYHYKPEINAFNNKTEWVVKSLQSIKTDLKHQSEILDILKLDVEGMEWVALRRALDDGTLFKVRYLLLEWHVCPTDFSDSKDIVFAQRLYHRIYEIGFLKYFNDPWMFNEFTGCHMILNYYVRPESFN